MEAMPRNTFCVGLLLGRLKESCDNMLIPGSEKDWFGSEKLPMISEMNSSFPIPYLVRNAGSLSLLSSIFFADCMKELISSPRCAVHY